MPFLVIISIWPVSDNAKSLSVCYYCMSTVVSQMEVRLATLLLSQMAYFDVIFWCFYNILFLTPITYSLAKHIEMNYKENEIWYGTAGMWVFFFSRLFFLTIIRSSQVL